MDSNQPCYRILVLTFYQLSYCRFADWRPKFGVYIRCQHKFFSLCLFWFWSAFSRGAHLLDSHICESKYLLISLYKYHYLLVFFRWPVINYYFFLPLINLTKFSWRAWKNVNFFNFIFRLSFIYFLCVSTPYSAVSTEI